MIRVWYNKVMDKICAVKECESPRKGTDFCRLHYNRWHYHKDISKITSSNKDKRSGIIDGDIAKIPLGKDAKGGYAIVDKDLAYIDSHKWRVGKNGYACGYITSSDEDGYHTTMHRFIAKPPIGMVIDHKDGDKLNNRMSNLRVCTQVENMQNRVAASKPKTSKYKGVCWSKKDNRWRATIKVSGKQIGLGYFRDEELASRAYDEACVRYFGEFAKGNVS